MEVRIKRIIGDLTIIVAIVLAFAIGIILGIKTTTQERTGIVGEIVNKALGIPSDFDFSLYWDVVDLIEDNFPGNTDRQKLIYGAARGTVEALGDRYSLFLDPDEAKKFFEDIKGEFSGIGAEITQEHNQFLIVAPLPDSPAEKAGLKPKDIIVTIDGKKTEEMEFGQLINAIRGEKGTNVILGIFREGFEDIRDFTVTRDTIMVDSVQAKILDNDLAYVKIIQFSDDTMTEMKKAIDNFQDKDIQGLILDLRNDPGGFLDAAIDITSLFLDRGPIVIEERKDGQRKNFEPTGEPILKSFPLVVLVNNGSASAAEILAGAIQDRKEGTLIGTKTFGKGSVQEVEMLKDGSALRLTIAKWLTPNGRAINGEGIIPDIIVEEEVTKEKDPQLDRAQEVLLEQIRTKTIP